MKEIVYLNNQYLPKEDAVISMNDRGFQFADGVYEVIKFYKGIPFRIEEHMMRLVHSLNAIKINYPDVANLKNICSNLLQKNMLNNTDSGIYIQITRGSHQRMHAFPEGITPTLCMEAFEMPARKELLQKGIKVITRPDIRWLRCDIKSVSLLGNVLMIQEATELGAKECILVRDKKVTEATHSNALGVKNGSIITHPDSTYILPGITKGAVKDICRMYNIEFKEQPFTEKEIYTLDELFLSGTGNEIMPVIRVNETNIGNGSPGPVTRMIQTHFFEMTYGKVYEDCWWNW